MRSVPTLSESAAVQEYAERGECRGVFVKGRAPVEMERKWREEKAKTDPL